MPSLKVANAEESSIMGTLGHAEELPFPRGTLVRDERTDRAGYLMGVLVESSPDGRVVSETAYLRPVGGGREWDTPIGRIQVVMS
ncbi:hypothetical protein WDH52_08640 [Streptomyces sp. TRM70308]|uniref:hypothetical protein n=1 Tax=Streptomyces sp. TRM70308 TaxID=3131932 RepID=UPI003CFE1EC4